MRNSPHIRVEGNVTKVMMDVIIALMPALLFSIYKFRAEGFLLLLTGVATCVVCEVLYSFIFKKDSRSLFDLSAVVTGLLYSMIIPPNLPLKLVFLGGVVAILFGKMIFGGLGRNLINPAILGRVFLFLTFPLQMTTWRSLDGKLGPTIIGEWHTVGYDGLKYFYENNLEIYKMLFLGNISGSLGEMSALLLILGGVYLLYKKRISWHIPFACLATIALAMFFSGHDPIFHLLSGGVVLGSIYMATDMVTSPTTRLGKFLFGVIIGAGVVIIRLNSIMPEGMSFSILIANLTVPMIDRVTVPRVYGRKTEKLKRFAGIPAVILISLLMFSSFAVSKQMKLDRPVSFSYEFSDLTEDFLPKDAAVFTDGRIDSSHYSFYPVKGGGGKILSYVSPVVCPAYVLNVEFLIDIDLDGEVKKLKILKSHETHNLGSNIKSKEWESLWIGRDKSYEFEKEVDAFAGATLTPREVHKAVIDVLSEYEEVMGIGKDSFEGVEDFDLELDI